MKAILIDPTVLTAVGGTLAIDPRPPIIEVEYAGGFPEAYQLLSHPDREVTVIDAARFNNGDAVYIDDEGLFNATSFFIVDGDTIPLAGRGLLVGTDAEGGDTSPKTTIEELWMKVRFALANVEVSLRDVPVGAHISPRAIKYTRSTVAARWAEELGA